MSATIAIDDSSPQLARARALHSELVAARQGLARARHRVAVLLREFVDDALHRELGCATLEEYADRLLKLDVRTAQDLLTLGRRLVHLPQLDARMAEGELEWTKIREIARVATEETEGVWLGFAEGRSAREIERAVRGRDVGDAPPTEGEPPKRPARQRLVYTVEAGDAEAVRQMIAFVVVQMGAKRGEIEDGAVLAAVARRVLQEPTFVTGTHVGQAAFGSAARGPAVATGDVAGEADSSGAAARFGTAADAMGTGTGCTVAGSSASTGTGERSGSAGATGADTRAGSGVATVADARGDDAATSAGKGKSARTGMGLGTHVGAPTGEPYRIVLECCPACGKVDGVDAEVSDTIALESACDAEVHHDGDVTHEIPARTRRQVLARDRWRCVVPGCNCRLWVHVHHLKSRALGGTHDARNLISLCSLHHRLVHEGRLATWRQGDEIVIEHADGTRQTLRR